MGQVPVTVTGVVTDAGNNPATSGFVQFDIQPKISSVHYFVPNVGTITQTVQCGIDGTGNVKSQLNLANPCLVWGNDVISPGNTTYKITLAPNGNITNVVNGECLSGGTYTLNNPVFCPIVQITPQQTIIRSNPFQVNIIPNATNTYNIGSPQAQFAAVYASNLFLNGSLFNSANVAFLNVANVFTQTNTFPAIKSSSANTAATGFIRMASSDSIAWRNFANGADVTISLTGAASGNRPADTLVPNGGAGGWWSNFYSDSSLSSAATGAFRLASGSTVNWRNNANNADLALSKNSSDFLSWPFYIISQGYQSNSPNPATGSATIRLANTDIISWRNNANTGDVTLTKTGALNGNYPADTFQPSSGYGAPFFASQNTAVAATGAFRLASGDSVTWRNNANNADIGLSKNTSDNLVFPNGLSLGGDSAFSASPRSTLTVFFPGALTATWTQLTWVTTKPIISIQIRTQAKTAPVGCTPNAVIRIGDGATNVDTTITALANGGAIGTSWGAPTTITVAVLTAAAGCGTAPSDVTLFMEYRTQ
jgi:hypothetical protein